MKNFKSRCTTTWVLLILTSIAFCFGIISYLSLWDVIKHAENLAEAFFGTLLLFILYIFCIFAFGILDIITLAVGGRSLKIFGKAPALVWPVVLAVIETVAVIAGTIVLFVS